MLYPRPSGQRCRDRTTRTSPLTGALLGLVLCGCAASGVTPDPSITVQLDVTDSTPTPSTATTSAPVPSSTATVAPAVGPPPMPGRYTVPVTEAEPEVKQLAVDIAHALTNYEQTADHTRRLTVLTGHEGSQELLDAADPLLYAGSWSRGEVLYPQLGGLRNDRASVMVVTRQTVGSGADPEWSVVRTLDIRLARGAGGWEFDALGSAGGEFDDLRALRAAHAVASDDRILLPDSARLDILSGLISPTLLDVMIELAGETPYEVVVLATGHPLNVFETDRLSQHTIGEAVDINRIGGTLVVDDRTLGSDTHAAVEWLYDHPAVAQVGSPWDLDGPGARRSFTDAVHQDHIHLAVVG